MDGQRWHRTNTSRRPNDLKRDHSPAHHRAFSTGKRYPFVKNPFTVSDLLMADEVFLSSTTAEIIPFTMVDDRRIGTGKPGPVVRKLQRLLQEDIEKHAGHTIKKRNSMKAKNSDNNKKKNFSKRSIA